MKAKIIGIGAAGNKAAINLIEKGIVDENDIILLNSTLRDIPDEYRRLGIQFTNSPGGCGKERKIANNLVLQSIENETINFEELLSDANLCIIVSSSEGGTGSGAATILAKFINEVIGVKVHNFVFTGFEEDARGLKNTVEYFKDLDDSAIVEAISNKKFTTGVGLNKIKAEKDANDEFAKQISVLLEKGIVDSEQNIDDRDIEKVLTTPGYIQIGKISLDGVKNVEMFNKTCSDMIDNLYCLDADSSAKRLAVFINANEKILESVDFSFNVIKEKLGFPFESFTHCQKEPGEQFISFIASGMKMPIDEIEATYENYKRESEKVNKAKDDFYSKANQFESIEDDDMFNTSAEKKTVSKSDFFKNLNKNSDNSKVSESDFPKASVVKKEKGFTDTNKSQAAKDFVKSQY